MSGPRPRGAAGIESGSGDGGGPPRVSAHDALCGLPPSAKYVAYVLLARGPLTQEGIIAATGLPGRTTRYALERLDELGDILVKRPCIEDARKRRYALDLG